METNKLVAGIVAAAIAVIVLAGVLMPALNNATTTHETFKNEGYYTMDKLTTDTDVTIKWAKNDLNVVTVNDVDIDMSKFVTNGRSYTLIGSDTFILRYQKNNDTFAGIQIYAADGYASFHSNSAATVGNEATVTVQNNEITLTSDGTSPLNNTYQNIGTDGYIIDPSGTGNYAIMKKADVPAYVKGNSEIRLIGVSVSEGPTGIGIFGAGTIDDGITLSTVYKNNTVTSVTYSDPVVTDQAVNGYDDLYKLDKYEFTITYDTSTFDATYSYFIVPLEVTAEKTVHLDPAMNTILSVIPIMIIVAVLLGVVAIFIIRRE